MNDSNTNSDPISGATPMSDTKILSAEDVSRFLFAAARTSPDYELFRELEASHAAQAKRIEELTEDVRRAEAAERELTLQLGEHSTFWNVKEETAIECISRLGQDKERVESLLLQIQAALPAERALEIAGKLKCWRCNGEGVYRRVLAGADEDENPWSACTCTGIFALELRAYAAAAMKEPK